MHHAERLYLPLPHGQTLVAYRYGDEDYPSIDIFIETQNGTHEKLCFAEYNPSREPGHELCIGLYAPDQEDPIHYESYIASTTAEECIADDEKPH